MAIRVPWSEKEEAVLLYYLIEVLQNKISRKTAVSTVSKKLRRLAVESGMAIDEKFRNENGISCQMSCLEYAYTKGKSGLPAKTGWYFKIVDMYETNREKFEQLLAEVMDQNSMDHFNDSRTGNFLAQTDVADAGGVQNEIRENSKRYVSWIIKQGFNQKQVQDSLFALKQCDRYAIEKHYVDRSVYLITTVSILKKLKQKLFEEDTIFQIFDKKMNYRFYAAFELYIKFNRAAEQVHMLKKPQVAENDVISEQPEEKYVLILKEFFPDGLRQNVIHIKKFMQCYEEKFKEAINTGRDELLSYLKNIGTVRDGRIYAKKLPEQDSLSDEIFKDILHVFQKGGTCIYLSMILQRYGRQLGEKLNIYNEETLQAFLNEYRPEDYEIYNGCINSTQRRGDYKTDVLSYMKNKYMPVVYETIQSELWYLPMKKIKHALMQIPSVVNVDKEAYFYAPNLPISLDEQKILRNALQKEIAQRGFLTGKHLKILMEEHCPSAAFDTAFLKDWGLRNVISYLFRDYFEFNGSTVVEKGQIFSVSDAYHQFCSERERLMLYELEEFSAEISSPISWKDVFSVMVRVSESEFIREDKIHFDIKAVDEILDTICKGDYIPIRDVELFLQFPTVEVPWNGFVLECYLRKYSRQFRLDQPRVVKTGYYGVMVRRDSILKNYEQVVTDILARSNQWKNEKDALELLVSRGCQAQRSLDHLSHIMKQALLMRERIDNK